MALKCYYWIVFCFSGDLCSDFCDFAYFRCEKYEMQVCRLVKSQVKYTKCRLKLLCFYEKNVEFVKTWNSKKSIQSLFFSFFVLFLCDREREKIKIWVPPQMDLKYHLLCYLFLLQKRLCQMIFIKKKVKKSRFKPIKKCISGGHIKQIFFEKECDFCKSRCW